MGIIMRWKNLNYKRDIVIVRNYSQKGWVSWVVNFEGVSVKMTPGISLRFPWYSQVYTVKEFSVGPIVLDSRVSERLLDTLTLKK